MNLHTQQIGTISELMNRLLTWSLAQYNGKCLKYGKSIRCLIYLFNVNGIFQSEGRKWLFQMLSLIWSLHKVQPSVMWFSRQFGTKQDGVLAFISVLLFIFDTGFVFIPKGVFFITDSDRNLVNTACLSRKANINISNMSSFMSMSPWL